MILTLLQNGDYETARKQALAELENNPEKVLNFIILQHGRTMHLVKKMPQSPFMRKPFSLVFLLILAKKRI